MRALQKGERISVRNPTSTRPWQHVLEPLAGYLTLATRLLHDPVPNQSVEIEMLASAFNFGPWLSSNRTVSELVREITRNAPGEWIEEASSVGRHEAGRLHLAIDKAFHLLNWRPVWGFERTVAETVRWYTEAAAGDPGEILRRQIQTYVRDAAKAGLEWAQ
jgi:CDP-glucose 4,6-dehydratase